MRLFPSQHYNSVRDWYYFSESSKRMTVRKDTTFTANQGVSATVGPLPLPSVKRYFEVEIITDTSNKIAVGLSSKLWNSRWGNVEDLYVWHATAGILRNNNTVVTVPGTEGTFTGGDNVMVAYDPVTGTMWWGKNGTWNQGWNPATPTGGITGTQGTNDDDRCNSMMPYIECGLDSATSSITMDARFNLVAADMNYTVPSGFSCWDTADNPDVVAREIVWYPQPFVHKSEPEIDPREGTIYPARVVTDDVRFIGGRAWFRGTDYVDGYVDLAGVPGQRRVRLYSDTTGDLLGETWSDPTTGYFRFDGTDPTKVYMVTGQDYTRTYDAVTHDYLKST
jgi:hypothetical protein